MIEVGLTDHMGSDLTVVNAARVSFSKESHWFIHDPDDVSHLHVADVRLIRYLAKHKHMSPFGHCFASFRVKAPVFVARQLVKHKFLRWNEVSRRYVDYDPEFYEPETWRGKAEDKKQGSAGNIESSCVVDQFGELCHPMFAADDINKFAMATYENMITAGVCPEQARIVLPQSMMTEWWWSGSLDAFADMCNLRCKADTQYETQNVADQINDIMIELFPVSWRALTVF